MTHKKIKQSLKSPNKLPTFILEIPGLTSETSQSFLNTICSNGKYNVLEIGAYCGASSMAMLYNNIINLTVIDLWNTHEVKPNNSMIESIDIIDPKKEFLKNTKDYNISILDGDAFSIEIFKELEKREKYDIIFYDGPHDIESIIKFFLLYTPFVKDNGLIIVDDYNFYTVQEAIKIIKQEYFIKFKYEKKILTVGESKKTFWNGLYMCII